jgi:hypothetical protein
MRKGIIGYTGAAGYNVGPNHNRDTEMIDLKSVVQRKRDLLSYQMDSETVMMSVEQGEYFALDEVGGRIWELIERPYTVSSLCDLLGREFDVDAEDCRKDVLEYLNKLLDLGIIEVANGPRP